MKLKTAKIILYICCALIAISLFACSATRNTTFGYLGIVLAFVGVAFWFLFGRCPSCGKFLGRTYDKHCPHCGEKIE